MTFNNSNWYMSLCVCTAFQDTAKGLKFKVPVSRCSEFSKITLLCFSSQLYCSLLQSRSMARQRKGTKRMVERQPQTLILILFHFRQ